MRTLAVFFIAAAITMPTRHAEACSPAPCSASTVAPAQGATIPANAPALVFSPGSMMFGLDAGPLSPVTLKTKDGVAVPFTVDGSLVKPTSTLPIGGLVFGYDEGCNPSGSGTSVVKKEVSFTVGPDAPLPTIAGTFGSTVYARRGVEVITSSGSCTATIDAAVAELKLVMDPKFAPFLPLASFTTTVDGKPWATIPAGGRPTPPRFSMEWGAHAHDIVFAACGAAVDKLADRGLLEGKHKVSVVAAIAGGPTLPALEIEVDLTCGTVGGDVGPGDVGTGDADAGPTSPAADSADAGCSAAAPTHGATRPWSFLAASLVALALARRSRAEA